MVDGDGVTVAMLAVGVAEGEGVMATGVNDAGVFKTVGAVGEALSTACIVSATMVSMAI